MTHGGNRTDSSRRASTRPFRRRCRCGVELLRVVAERRGASGRRRVYVAGVRAVFSFLRQEDGALRRHRAARRRALGRDWRLRRPAARAPRLLLRAAARRCACRAALFLARRRRAGDVGRVRGHDPLAARAPARSTITRSLFCDVRDGRAGAAVRVLRGRRSRPASRRLDSTRTCGSTQCHGAGRRRLHAVGHRRRLRGRTRRRPSCCAVLLAGGIAAGAPRAGARRRPARERVLVMPFENASKQARLAWLAEGSSILLADELEAARRRRDDAATSACAPSSGSRCRRSRR